MLFQLSVVLNESLPNVFDGILKKSRLNLSNDENNSGLNNSVDKISQKRFSLIIDVS